MDDETKASDRRRIILLFDGTWNDAAFATTDTNIVRLRELINAGLSDEREAHERAKREARKHSKPPPTPEFAKTLVLYRRGVGTDGTRDSFLGGAFGAGLADNVRRGYRFLAQHYRPGDQVFVFGFSRGAFTARSLVGYLGAIGLLRDGLCTPELESAAWAHYRTPPGDRSPGEWNALGAYMHPRERLRIAALCVFDTVGALGIPGNLRIRANRRRFEFHNVEMPSITDMNLHAIAIDEQRRPFEATVWRRHKFKPEQQAQTTEQVWFSGVHADIGGGYPRGDGRKGRQQALEDIPLDWMLRRLKSRFENFPAQPALLTQPDGALATAAPHQSRKGAYRIWPPAHRAIANTELPGLSRPRALDVILRTPGLVSQERNEALAGEGVHISAIERLGVQLADGTIYAPRALAGILPDLAISYRQGAPEAGPNTLLVVGWDAMRIDPKGKDAPIARSAIAAASRRLYGM